MFPASALTPTVYYNDKWYNSTNTASAAIRATITITAT